MNKIVKRIMRLIAAKEIFFIRLYLTPFSVEKHIKNTYFKKVQAPVGVKAALKAWMELS